MSSDFSQPPTPNNAFLREFYDDLYRSDQIRNPAVKIYDQLRVEQIKSLADHVQGNILIVGCGSNLDRDIFIDQNNVYIFDLSYFAVRSIHLDNMNAFTADALSIPLPSRSFALIVCSEVLEHIPQIRMVISEFARLLTPSGVLVVSSPNWLSWFGFARWIGEKIKKAPIHSSDQPYDDWKTYFKYKKELAPWFKIVATRGVWYLPPLHYRGKGVPERTMNAIYNFYSPFEQLLSRMLPTFGHLIVLKCTLQQSQSG